MVALNQQMISDGEALLRSLDESESNVPVAFWSYFSEIDDWKLILCLPGKDQKEAYTLIQKRLHATDDIKSLRIDQVGVIKPEAPIIRLLSSAINTNKGISGIRFTNNVINGTLIEDAFIYRLTKAA